MVWNGSPVTVRLLTWFPGPPYPATSPYIVAAYTAGGAQSQKGGILLSNTGTPVTWGCHGQITYYGAAPVGSISCTYSAPTRGSNSFNCNGRVAWLQWKEDANDIFVMVHVYEKGPAAPAQGSFIYEQGPPLMPAKPAPPKPSPEDRKAKALALKASDLTGAGWSAKTSTKSIGTLWQLWKKGSESQSCEDHSNKGEVGARGTGGSLFVRDGGKQSAFSIVGLFPTASAADKTFDESLTPHSANCLAQLLSVNQGALHTTATATPHIFTAMDVRNDGYRIVIRGQVNKRAWRGYLDVFSLQHESKWSLVGLFRRGSPMSQNAEKRAVVAVGERIRR